MQHLVSTGYCTLYMVTEKENCQASLPANHSIASNSITKVLDANKHQTKHYTKLMANAAKLWPNLIFLVWTRYLCLQEYPISLFNP
jgi:hypothetical protein